MTGKRVFVISTIFCVCAAGVAGCSGGGSQQPAPLGSGAPGSTAPASASASPSASAAGTGWVVNPDSIALPAGLTVRWDYTASGKADVDQAVEVVEDINRAELAGVGDTPQNPKLINFSQYATGETLDWINATFSNYASNDNTWTGVAHFYKFATQDFTGSGTGESGIVQFCTDGSGLMDVSRSTGAKTPDSSSTALVTFKVTKVAGGWQAGNFSAVVKDATCSAG